MAHLGPRPRLPHAAGRKGTMAKEICISSTPHETRLAILEDDQLAEIYYERENEYTLAGSIYNGRVTRVLPGMQSAFVDLGLERDAFLYVTDFLELEDQDESEELEKAAVAGGNQPPREVRHGNGQQPSQRQEPRADRPGRTDRDRRPVEPAATLSPVEPDEPEFAAPTRQDADSDTEGASEGGKRWRGRRRRRGGRVAPVSVSDPVETETSAETFLEPSEMDDPEVAPEIHAAGESAAPPERSSSAHWRPAAEPAARTPRSDRAPSPLVLPGESLSKYGGEPLSESSKAEAPAPPPRPKSTFKPATLIESPLQWDGTGLLPGESLSRHRQAEPGTSAAVHGEPQGVFADATQAAPAEEGFVEETEELAPQQEAPIAEPAAWAAETNEIGSDEEFETEELVMEEEPLPGAPSEPQVAVNHDPFESDSFFSRGYAQEEHSGEARDSGEDSNFASNPTEPAIHQPDADEAIAEPTHILTTDPDKPGEGTSEPDADDRSASHRVDPNPPSGFRLFGFGSGKKRSDEPALPPSEPARSEPQAGTAKSVSAFAPGTGVVEEEVIEGDEFEAPRHHHKSDEHDLDEYEEEEKLHTQIRSGELGEMLQEAHLDHRIQLDFEEKGGAEVEGEDVFDIDDEDEEDEASEPEAVPAGNAAAEPAQPRRDRGGRARRGGRAPQQGGRRGPSRRSAQTSDLPIISDLLKPGQEILVQIAKEPIAKKGARITSHIALPGRFLVFMPTVNHVGVSRKIASEEERHRLKRILISERGESSGGFIVRTAAEGASEEELRSDLRFLIHLWEEIKQRSENSKSPALIYHDLSLIERILRDQISAGDFDDSERALMSAHRFSRKRRSLRNSSSLAPSAAVRTMNPPEASPRSLVRMRFNRARSSSEEILRLTPT